MCYLIVVSAAGSGTNRYDIDFTVKICISHLESEVTCHIFGGQIFSHLDSRVLCQRERIRLTPFELKTFLLGR